MNIFYTISNVLQNFFWFLVILLVVVFIHELGHFMVARWRGVKVELFSIGFGAPMWSRKDKHGTEWRISYIPAGGYVKMFGDGNVASVENEQDPDYIPKEQRHLAFKHKKIWEKAMIVFAGPAANILLTLLLIFGLMAYQTAKDEGVVLSVADSSLAQAAGLQVGDKVLEIDGRDKISYDHRLICGQNVKMKLLRSGEVIEKSIKMEASKKPGGQVMCRLGIVIGESSVPYFRIFMHSVGTTFRYAADVLKVIGNIGDNYKKLGGPLRVAQQSKSYAEAGMFHFLWFVAILSLNLAIMNLLPIPILDGGHLLYYAMESVLPLPLVNKMRHVGYKLGFVLLILLMIFATWNDVVSFFYKGKVSLIS